MQTILTALCDGTTSLRDKMANDHKLKDFDMRVSMVKVKGRAPGWTKIHSVSNVPGAANVVWDRASRTLTCRLVRKGKPHVPHALLANLTAYLMARHYRRIKVLSISTAK